MLNPFSKENIQEAALKVGMTTEYFLRRIKDTHEAIEDPVEANKSAVAMSGAVLPYVAKKLGNEDEKASAPQMIINIKNFSMNKGDSLDDLKNVTDV
jgi:adenosine/AMP kinase